MDNNEKKEGMKCDNCGWGHGMHHAKMVVLRWLLGLIILFVVFSLGVKIGEFKQEMMGGWGSPYGYGMMGGGYDSYYYSRTPMMGGYRYQVSPTAPTAPTTAPKQ